MKAGKQTALHEVNEETVIDIKLFSKKRYIISFVQEEKINKEVIYFFCAFADKDLQKNTKRN